MNNNFNIKNLNANNSAINMGGTIQGDQIGTQNQYAHDPEVTSAIASLQTLLTQLRQKYPNATDEQLFQTLINGFAEMPQQNPQNWQRWRDVFSVLFSGGIEATKVFVPMAGIPIEVIKKLYEIYDRDRKQLPKG